MDGRVLSEVFTPEYQTAAPAPTAAGPVATASAPEDGGSYSSEDEEKISERLKALGYVE
jgi:hypothetical protein